MKFANSFHHQPELTAHTCLFLASGAVSFLSILMVGKANKLKGRYLDVEQDIGEWVANADEVIARDLNHLKVEFLGKVSDESPHGRKFTGTASK
jgi:hypothetical protein